MTDARLPSHWLTDPAMDALSDRAFRTFAGSLMWSNQSGTDGYLPRVSLRFFHPLGVDDNTAAELVRSGRWEAAGDGYQVTRWERSQSLAADVEYQRERNRRNVMNNRERERKRRAEARAVSGDVSGDVSEHVGGQDRTGQAGLI